MISGFQSCGIMGLGLLGGSFARALREEFDGITILGADTSMATLEEARDEGVVDAFFDPFATEALPDLLVLATPISVIVETLQRILPLLGQHERLVIDLGSVKGTLMDALGDLSGIERFVPCHPMAGSEKKGYRYSRADLFRGAHCMITPHENNKPDDVTMIAELWETLGAIVSRQSPHAHDRIVARTSHVPHLLAGLPLLLKGDDENWQGGCGSGLRDMTRIAAGDPELWTDIIHNNREEVLLALEESVVQITRLIELVSSEETDTLTRHLGLVKNLRDSLYA